MDKIVEITTETINLDALLKWASLCTTGGEAKEAIQSGQVTLNGVTETRRQKKIRPGDAVTYMGVTVQVKGK